MKAIRGFPVPQRYFDDLRMVGYRYPITCLIQLEKRSQKQPLKTDDYAATLRNVIMYHIMAESRPIVVGFYCESNDIRCSLPFTLICDERS